jgi:hypothetical protein
LRDYVFLRVKDLDVWVRRDEIKAMSLLAENIVVWSDKTGKEFECAFSSSEQARNFICHVTGFSVYDYNLRGSMYD